jgi:hypothetical protein
MSEYFEGTVYVRRHLHGVPKPETWTMREGETSDLVQRGHARKKYTHHPVAVVYELMEDKRFRHLSIERLHELVDIWGATRVMSWTSVYYSDFDAKLEKIQIDPNQTIRPIAILGGLSCMCCDGMAWEAPIDNKEDSRYIPVEVEETFKRVTFRQLIFSDLWDGCSMSPMPVLCFQCHMKTLKVRRTNDHHAYDRVHALKCLAELTKQTAGANNENRPTQSRKRRINSR